MTDIQRETDREIERQTEAQRETDSQTERDIETETERDRDKDTGRKENIYYAVYATDNLLFFSFLAQWPSIITCFKTSV